MKESGVYAVENYIMARYHMYWQVYYHPVARSYETVLHLLFKRLKDLGMENVDEHVIPLFYPIINGRKISLQDYFELDESTCGYGFQQLTRHSDPIIVDLAQRIRDRHLFEYQDSQDKENRKIKKLLKEKGFDTHYYWAKDEVAQSPYVPYSGAGTGSIWVRMKDGSTKELSNASNIVYSLIHGPEKDDNKVFFPMVTK